MDDCHIRYVQLLSVQFHVRSSVRKVATPNLLNSNNLTKSCARVWISGVSVT